MTLNVPFAGFGLGLRREHYSDVLDRPADLDFVEVISENFMVDGGRPRQVLKHVRERHPVALHGVSMSVGSVEEPDRDYLKRLRALVDDVEPLFVSDHLSWSRTAHFNSHDLLPLPYTEETLAIVCRNVGIAQDVLGRSMLLENPSSYVVFDGNAMTEWDFLREVVDGTGCELLLDLNNVFVSATNHGFDATTFLERLPLERVRQLHLAGHTEGDTHLIDTHDQPVCDDVWCLFREIYPRLGPVAVMIERDAHIPPFSDLVAELEIARTLAGVAIEERG
jgi:uncharacterized protein (UPF0276 family)